MKRFEELSDYQRIVLSAYLGVLMCEPGDLILYLSDKFDRRVDSGEFTDPNFFSEVRIVVQEDFEKMIGGELA